MMKKEGSDKGQIWSFWLMNRLFLWKKHFEALPMGQTWDVLAPIPGWFPIAFSSGPWWQKSLVGWLQPQGAWARGCHLHWTWENPLVILTILDSSWHIFTNNNGDIQHPTTINQVGWRENLPEIIGGFHMFFPVKHGVFQHVLPFVTTHSHQGHASPQLAAGHHQPQQQPPLAALERRQRRTAAERRRGAAAQCGELRLLGWGSWQGHSYGIPSTWWFIPLGKWVITFNPSYKWTNPTYPIYNQGYNPLTKWDEPPSSKHRKSYWKWPLILDLSDLSMKNMVMFHSKLLPVFVGLVSGKTETGHPHIYW